MPKVILVMPSKGSWYTEGVDHEVFEICRSRRTVLNVGQSDEVEGKWKRPRDDSPLSSYWFDKRDCQVVKKNLILIRRK